MTKQKTGLDRLPSGWAKTVSTAYLNGASDVEVRAELRVTKKLWDHLYNDPISSEFKEIVDFGRMLSKAWWMAQARTNLKDRQFNANLWHTYMKNMFGWSDKTEITTKDSESLTSDELDQRIDQAMKKFAKVVKG